MFFWHDWDMGARTIPILFQGTIVDQECYEVRTNISVVTYSRDARRRAVAGDFHPILFMLLKFFAEGTHICFGLILELFHGGEREGLPLLLEECEKTFCFRCSVTILMCGDTNRAAVR